MIPIRVKDKIIGVDIILCNEFPDYHYLTATVKLSPIL
jgi:hypothetical protein